jgi:acylphosphatase
MKCIHAVISGEVQGVGYREKVKRLAFELNICGRVMNLEDGRVDIIAEGENGNIDEFFGKIHIRTYPIFVEDIQTEETMFEGQFRSFRIVRDKDIQKELLSAISRGTVEIHEMKEILIAVKEDTSGIPEIQTNTRIMLEKQDSMLEKQDSMLEKQDSMLEKQDSMLEKQDDHIRITENGFTEMKGCIREVKDEIHFMRDDFREKFKKDVDQLRNEISEIKATLARMQEAG